MSVKDWTPKQIDNVIKYGVCRLCGEPMERYTNFEPPVTPETAEPGKEYRVWLACANGHRR